jgi:hypothetical protein
VPAVPGQPSGSAFDDHNLANVAIDGLITIFKKPPEQPAAASGAQETPPASALQEAPADVTEHQTDVGAESMPAEAGDRAETESLESPVADEPADEGDKPGTDARTGDEERAPDRTPDGS